MIRDRRPMRMLGILAVALVVLFSPGFPARAQEPAAKPRDEALDDLLKDLKEADRKDAPAEPKPSKPDPSQAKGKEAPKGKPEGAGAGAGANPGGKPAPPKPAGEEVSGKDKDIDDLLEKLGETKDEPAPEERQPGGGGKGGEPGPPGGGKGKDEPPGPGAGGLAGKDRELDEKLEEFAGIRRKKKRDDSGGSGPTSEIIKQMREVEQRLGKPETGGETQAKQKEIVKKIETLIEQMKQSGSSSSKSMRMVQQQQPQSQPGGQKPGQEPGTNPGGAPLQKSLKPSDRHAMAGGKDVWGHLPAELRQEMDNVFKEEALSTKVDMIRRYYLSVAKQKLVRGE
ncbi:hypothetical protein [Aquisphaera insulae]|uniref:hypothetical protein n=1 Tax=Aquisphaera insulae TaxID=2712864 RepID=UPI0013EA2B36|nr:hypothetical protein [Aquisphaera insulae]